jgi:hypothetical protein
MPKIQCKCGNIISLGAIPSPHQWLIISDEEYDEHFSSELINADYLHLKMKIVVTCEHCQRCHFYINGFNQKPITFIRES